MDPANEGLKYDQGKVRLDLLDVDFLTEMAHILTFGAKKYDDHNWRKGMAWSRPLGAAMRHLFAWSRGQQLDPEHGHSHLAAAAVNLMFLFTYLNEGAGTNDLYFKEPKS